MEQLTNASGISILTTSLASIDRRTLSQAWYSALHVVAASAAHPNAGAPRSAGSDGSARRAPCERRVRAAGARALPRDRAASLSAPIGTLAGSERRAPRSPLARAIERTFLHPRRAPRRAVFAVEAGGARVHIALQFSGKAVRLIALCPAAARPIVLRALEQARYALAARGIDLESCEIGGLSC